MFYIYACIITNSRNAWFLFLPKFILNDRLNETPNSEVLLCSSCNCSKSFIMPIRLFSSRIVIKNLNWILEANVIILNKKLFVLASIAILPNGNEKFIVNKYSKDITNDVSKWVGGQKSQTRVDMCHFHCVMDVLTTKKLMRLLHRENGCGNNTIKYAIVWRKVNGAGGPNYPFSNIYKLI